MTASLVAGQIVIADWRDGLPREANKLRPAIVVEDHELFDPLYPNAILVPLTEDERLAIPELSVVIEPTSENGCSERCHALAHCVATTAKARITVTPSRITPAQLDEIRRRIGLSIGLG